MLGPSHIKRSALLFIIVLFATAKFEANFNLRGFLVQHLLKWAMTTTNPPAEDIRKEMFFNVFTMNAAVKESLILKHERHCFP